MTEQVVKCPVCGDDIAIKPSRKCCKCNTPHHIECLEYNGGCGVYGCKVNPNAILVKHKTNLTQLNGIKAFAVGLYNKICKNYFIICINRMLGVLISAVFYMPESQAKFLEENRIIRLGIDYPGVVHGIEMFVYPGVLIYLLINNHINLNRWCFMFLFILSISIPCCLRYLLGSKINGKQYSLPVFWYLLPSFWFSYLPGFLQKGLMNFWNFLRTVIIEIIEEGQTKLIEQQKERL